MIASVVGVLTWSRGFVGMVTLLSLVLTSSSVISWCGVLLVLCTPFADMPYVLSCRMNHQAMVREKLCSTDLQLTLAEDGLAGLLPSFSDHFLSEANVDSAYLVIHQWMILMKYSGMSTNTLVPCSFITSSVWLPG